MSVHFGDGLHAVGFRRLLLRRLLNLLILGVFGVIYVACDAGIRDCQLPSDCFGGEICVRGQCTLVSQDIDTQDSDSASVDTSSHDAARDTTVPPESCTHDFECDGDLVCDQGDCVQCTSGSRAACGRNSWNALTNLCTNTGVGSLVNCKPCTADSECKDPQSRCVPMEFKG